MALGQGMVKNFDDLFNSIIIGSLDKALGAVSNKVMGGLGALGEGMSSGLAMVSGTISNGLGSFMPTASAERELAPARASEISAPVQEVSKFHASEADLGQFSAPNFGSAMGGKSVGICVG